MRRGVLFVSSHAQLGGSERYLGDLVGRLDRGLVRGVIALQEGPFVERLQAGGLEVEVIPTGPRPRDLLAAAPALRRALSRSGASVVHANGVKAAGACVAAGLGRRTVWVKHDLSLDGRAGRLVASRCARVVGVSNAVLASVGASARTSVVMPGVAVDASPATGGADGPVVVMVGRLHPVKAHGELIAIAGELAERVDGLQVSIIGAEDPAFPGYAADLRAHAEGLPVRFLGFRDDAPALVAGAAVSVVTTGADPRAPRGEGFGYVAAESLLLGTPVVGYDIGALREVVGGCGIVMHPHRGALADAIVSVCTDDALRDRLVACGRERATRLFDPERWTRAMTTIYVEVAA